jgi:hypothetical protein
MKNTFLVLFALLSISLSAQDYFQQEVNYIIDVTLNDENHSLNGTEYIDYFNNSPDDLESIWFHIWPNSYKDNTTALAKQKIENGSTSLHYATEEERGYINGLDFKVNGERVKWDYHPEHIDICKLFLNKPLRAGQSIRISTPFFVKIPDAKFSRLGHVDQSYMITQWYPKPAVYDKDGWHLMPYLDMGEFYSEFGRFDVSITLPSNYTVGATGDLQNQEEITRLNKLAEITDTITQFSDDMSFPLSALDTKTLRYIQQDIHDFGWFADKRYHVLKGEVELPHSKKIVTLWTMFTNNEADLWKNSIEYMHDAVYYYSLWNGDYPYKHCSAVDGTISAGGGMEYPNVTVIGESGNAKYLELVIMHEVGHNWFYGMLGSNERLHPWMDEGINSHNELRYMRTKYPEYNMLTNNFPKFLRNTLDLEDYTNKQMMGELMYLMNAWTGKDQPIELHSAEYTENNYGGIVYSKTAIVFDYLMAYLGEDVYDKCMRAYFKKWQYKHPQPKDLRVVFEEVSGKDLAWFFEDVIGTIKQLDYAISDVKKETTDLFITLENKGGIAGPVIISGVKDGQSMDPLWTEGFEGKKIIRYLNGDYDHIRIDYNGDMPEKNRNNNIYKIKGLLKQCEPLKLQILGSLYHPEKTQVFFHPMMNYNIYNKHSFGLKIYNHFLPKGGFSYKLIPLYSMGTKNLTGEMNLAYTKYSQNSRFQNFTLSINGKQYLYDYDKEYTRIKPQLNIKLQKPSLRSKIDNYLSASYVYLEKENETLGFLNGRYTFSNARTFNPYSLHTKIEKGEEYSKAQLIMNLRKDLNPKKRLNVRAYLGYVNTSNDRYNLKMSAWNGSDDYMFSERVFSRDDNSAHKIHYQQQIFIREGGLKHFTNDSLNSNQFLASTYIDYNLFNPLELYTELGTNGSEFAYGSGLKLGLNANGPGFYGGIQFYLPLITEEGVVDFDNYANFLRFNIYFNLGELNFE